MRRFRRRDCGDGQREESGEIRLSVSTIKRSSSRARRAGRDDGDVKEKSSNIVFEKGGDAQMRDGIERSGYGRVSDTD